jgi:hypothetical protein
MDNTEEFSGQRSGPARLRPTRRARRAGSRASGSGQIRYAHGGPPPHVEPLCTVAQGAGPHGGSGGPQGSGGPWGGDLAGAWLGEPPVGGRQGDLWVLICGGIAAAAAFAAAFVAAGGVASHPAAPVTNRPAVVSQACPSPAAVPTPQSHQSPATHGARS